MPASVEIDSEHNRVTLELHGRIGVTESVTVLESIATDGRLRPGPDGIVDTTGVTGLDLAGGDIRALAAVAGRADALWSGGRWAIVAPLDLVYGMARMYQVFRSGAPYAIEVFRSRDEARDWLARAPAPEPPRGHG